MVGLMCSEAAVPPPTPLVPDSANHYADHPPIRLAPLVAMVTTSCFIVMFPHVHVQRERERELERCANEVRYCASVWFSLKIHFGQ